MPAEGGDPSPQLIVAEKSLVVPRGLASVNAPTGAVNDCACVSVSAGIDATRSGASVTSNVLTAVVVEPPASAITTLTVYVPSSKVWVPTTLNSPGEPGTTVPSVVTPSPHVIVAV